MPEATLEGEIKVGTADDAVHNDIGSVEGDGFSDSPTPSDELTSQQIVDQNPDIQDAFDRAFSGEAATPDAGPKPATRRKTQNTEEEAEELEGLEGADEADDGIEPEGDEETKPKTTDKEATGDADADAGEEGSDVPTLSPLLRHAAKRAGLSDKTIDLMVKADPEEADLSFNKLLDNFNDVSAQYGRNAQHAPRTQTTPGFMPGSPLQQAPAIQRYTPPQAAPAPTQAQQTLTDLYGDQNKIKELTEKYGEDFLGDIVAPMLQPIQQMMQMAEQQQLNAIAVEVGNFYKGLPKEFGELYGSGQDVSEEQTAARETLAMLADGIRTGTASQGIELSVDECMERANLQYAAEHMGSIERKKITAQVQKRSKSITQRPTQRRKALTDVKQSDEAAATAYAEKADELGYLNG